MVGILGDVVARPRFDPSELTRLQDQTVNDDHLFGFRGVGKDLKHGLIEGRDHFCGGVDIGRRDRQALGCVCHSRVLTHPVMDGQ